MQGVGVRGAKRLGEGRVPTFWLIGAVDDLIFLFFSFLLFLTFSHFLLYILLCSCHFSSLLKGSRKL